MKVYPTGDVGFDVADAFFHDGSESSAAAAAAFLLEHLDADDVQRNPGTGNILVRVAGDACFLNANTWAVVASKQDWAMSLEQEDFERRFSKIPEVDSLTAPPYTDMTDAWIQAMSPAARAIAPSADLRGVKNSDDAATLRAATILLLDDMDEEHTGHRARPARYTTAGGREVVDVMRDYVHARCDRHPALADLGDVVFSIAAEVQALKYSLRAGKKDGTDDVGKAGWWEAMAAAALGAGMDPRAERGAAFEPYQQQPLPPALLAQARARPLAGVQERLTLVGRFAAQHGLSAAEEEELQAAADAHLAAADAHEVSQRPLPAGALTVASGESGAIVATLVLEGWNGGEPFKITAKPAAAAAVLNAQMPGVYEPVTPVRLRWLASASAAGAAELSADEAEVRFRVEVEMDEYFVEATWGAGGRVAANGSAEHVCERINAGLPEGCPRLDAAYLRRLSEQS